MPAHDSQSIDRRSFLARATAGGALVATGGALVPLERYLPAAGAQVLDGAGAAAFMASVELAVADVYDILVDVLSPDAQARAERHRDHHEAHSDAFAELAAEAGEPNQRLIDALAPQLEAVTGGADAFRLLQSLENQLVVTGVHLLSLVEDVDVAGAIASVLPVESAHATALGFSLLDQGYQSWFPYGAFEAGDIALGLDPDAFPVA